MAIWQFARDTQPDSFWVSLRYFNIYRRRGQVLLLRRASPTGGLASIENGYLAVRPRHAAGFVLGFAALFQHLSPKGTSSTAAPSIADGRVSVDREWLSGSSPATRSRIRSGFRCAISTSIAEGDKFYCCAEHRRRAG